MPKKYLFKLLIVFVFSSFFAYADNPTATQIINVHIQQQNALILSGPTPNFNINSSELKPGKTTEITNHLTDFTIVLGDDSTKKIIGQLDMEMPPGMELYAYFAAPNGSKSTGLQKLSTTETDLIRNITNDTQTNTPNRITYHFYFGREALDQPSYSRQIIYTLLDQ